MAKRRKEWMAIVTVQFCGKEPEPIVIMQADLEHVATFRSVAAIQNVAEKHVLRDGVWSCFNFTSGEVVVL